MEYVRQYQNRINWENEPSIATPINETNLNKMDKALNYMDGKMLEVVNAIGNDKNVRNAMITSITQPRTLNAALDDYSGADQLADGDILVVKSTVEGTPTTGWILNIALTGLASVSVNLYSYNSVMFDASIQAGYGLIIKLDMTNSKGYVIGIMNDNGYVRQGKKSGTTVGAYATIDGYQNTASGHSSRAGGQFNVAGYTAQEVIGKYNDNKSTTLFEVGNGTSESAKSNAFEVYANGDAVVYGTLKDGSNNAYLKGIVPISNGGTGNSDGYIRTGLGSGETVGTGSTAEGAENIVSGEYSHVEGYMNTVTGNNSHGEGATTIADGDYCHVEGGYFQNSTGVGSWGEGDYCHVEGADCHVTGNFGHGEGWDNAVSGQAGHGEGAKNTVSGAYAHAENYHNTASGASSHADGIENTASGQMSHVSGEHNVASQRDQFVIGKYNDNQSSTLFEVGNGTANDARSNAFVVQSNGNIWSQGDAYVDDVNARGDVKDGQGNDLASVAALEASASGNPIIINAQDVAAKALTVEIEPKQSLHGYDHPWAGGAEKNKLNATLANMKSGNTRGTWNGNVYTYQGLNFEPVFDNDGNFMHVKVTGTATALTQFYTNSDGFTPLGNFILNGCPNGGSYSTFDIRANGVNDDHADRVDIGSGVTVNRTETGLGAMSVVITVRSGYNCGNGIIFKPMIRLASESDSSYIPYSNVCPISGRTEARVDDVGKNKVETPSATAFTTCGITLTTASNGETTLNGTSTAGSIDGDTFELPAGTYTISVGTTLPSGVWISLDGVPGAMISPTGKSISFTTTEAISTFTHIYVNAGVVFNNFKLNWMLEEGTTATPYEPYQHSSATIAFGQTVYGAIIDFKTGKGKIIKVGTTISGSNVTGISGGSAVDVAGGKRINTNISDAKYSGSGDVPPDIISDVLKTVSSTSIYSGTETCVVSANDIGGVVLRYMGADTVEKAQTALNNSPVQICYELATPIELTLTPAVLELLKGYNYITGDGEMQLVYIPESILPTAPTTDGTYRLICTVSNGVPSFSWAAN